MYECMNTVHEAKDNFELSTSRTTIEIFVVLFSLAAEVAAVAEVRSCYSTPNVIFTGWVVNILLKQQIHNSAVSAQLKSQTTPALFIL